jgi:hypothetical protein
VIIQDQLEFLRVVCNLAISFCRLTMHFVCPVKVAKMTRGSADQAAGQIIALINPSPRSPTKADIAAIITEAIEIGAPSALAAKQGPWRKAIAELDAAIAISTDMTVDDPGEAGQAMTDAAHGRVLAIEHDMYATAPTSWSDVGILAEVCFRQVWPTDDLHGPKSDALLAGEPECEMHEEAICALLKAIRLLSGPVG